MVYHLNIIRQEYGRRTLLHDLRQAYAAGRIHGFLGENGAGKTTLFRCMAGRLPFEGEPMFSPAGYHVTPLGWSDSTRPSSCRLMSTPKSTPRVC